MQNLMHEIIERIQVDATKSSAGGGQSQQFAPHFFARRVQAQNNHRMQLHGVRLPLPRDGYSAIVFRSGATRSRASVSFCTASAVVPGAISRSKSALSASTSIT